ncbi:hypothetical protein FRB93_010106 [Tulasnella sp. JGI-2019a]|nr:hypothetical protein FRB93_010106 [Tulasnella sp. JGI-2019a]
MAANYPPDTEDTIYARERSTYVPNPVLSGTDEGVKTTVKRRLIMRATNTFVPRQSINVESLATCVKSYLLEQMRHTLARVSVQYHMTKYTIGTVAMIVAIVPCDVNSVSALV